MIPVASGLRRGGASKGASAAFAISTPQTGEESIPLTWGLFGPVYAFTRPVVAVLTALIHERRRELAVVRVLGGSRRQQMGLVLHEALLLGLAGTLGGLLVGVAVGYVLVTVVNLQSFGWTLDFVVPSSLWLTFLAVVPACLVAGLFPALLSMRTAPVESLRVSG